MKTYTLFTLLLLIPILAYPNTKNNNFSRKIIEDTFNTVATILRITPTRDINLLRVEITESYDGKEIDIFEKKYNMKIKYSSTNWFIPPDLILLNRKSKIHNLAHELTHYFQYHYLGYDDYEDAFDDEVEDQAVWVQNQFR